MSHHAVEDPASCSIIHHLRESTEGTPACAKTKRRVVTSAVVIGDDVIVEPLRAIAEVGKVTSLFARILHRVFDHVDEIINAVLRMRREHVCGRNPVVHRKSNDRAAAGRIFVGHVSGL